MSELDGRVIRAVDVSSTSFRNSFSAIKDQKLRKEILATISEMLFASIDTAPRRWHLHQLTNKPVQSVLDSSKKVNAWTIHVTADDRYKASFTFEDCKVFFRLVDEHDVIDRRP